MEPMGIVMKRGNDVNDSMFDLLSSCSCCLLTYRPYRVHVTKVMTVHHPNKVAPWILRGRFAVAPNSLVVPTAVGQSV